MGFEYINGRLCCDGIRIEDIAKETKTPFYLYSKNEIEGKFLLYKEAFEKLSPLICYAAKANSNMAIFKLLANLGAGCDVASAGELFLALSAGFDQTKIVFNGNGKRENEIERAVLSSIFIIADSPDEFFLIDQKGRENKKKARVLLRVNPDISASTHPYIATGLARSKFGMKPSVVKELWSIGKGLANVELIGLSSHIGSQITEIEPFCENARKLVALALELKGVEYLDLGGGLGISYSGEKAPTPKDLAEALLPIFSGVGIKLIIEPGRSIVGSAGCLVTKVLYLKESHKTFIIVDCGMNDLIRPTLYKSFHRILPVSQNEEEEKITADIVGPLCEEGDFLGRERSIYRPKAGELLAIMDTGAYGFSMSSNYNARLRSSEVMVIDEKFYCIREAETEEDLVCHQRIPDVLK
ncbi:diaminopimelate decarboxylase [bacterium]|nr:diaminopimelate decarboxylase [bacterium]MBU2462030.1 diaminopimelate decarboxylase [bacterium]